MLSSISIRNMYVEIYACIPILKSLVGQEKLYSIGFSIKKKCYKLREEEIAIYFYCYWFFLQVYYLCTPFSLLFNSHFEQRVDQNRSLSLKHEYNTNI